MAILLEEIDDYLDFVEEVKKQLIRLNPICAARVQIVPSLKHANALERSRYLAATTATHWDLEKRRYLLAQMGRFGHSMHSTNVPPKINGPFR